MNFRYAISEGFTPVIVKSLPPGDKLGDMWTQCRYCQGDGPVTLNQKEVGLVSGLLKRFEILVPVHEHCYESAVKETKILS